MYGQNQGWPERPAQLQPLRISFPVDVDTGCIHTRVNLEGRRVHVALVMAAPKLGSGRGMPGKAGVRPKSGDAQLGQPES